MLGGMKQIQITYNISISLCQKDNVPMMAFVSFNCILNSVIQ